jgi:hypothetical protein
MVLLNVVCTSSKKNHMLPAVGSSVSSSPWIATRTRPYWPRCSSSHCSGSPQSTTNPPWNICSCKLQAVRKAVRKLNTFIHHQIMHLNKKDRIPADSWVHGDKVSWRIKMLVGIIKGNEILRKKNIKYRRK